MHIPLANLIGELLFGCLLVAWFFTGNIFYGILVVLLLALSLFVYYFSYPRSLYVIGQ